MTAPWSPMVAPPLPTANDAERDTCPHAYPAEDCYGMAHTYDVPTPPPRPPSPMDPHIRAIVADVARRNRELLERLERSDD